MGESARDKAERKVRDAERVLDRHGTVFRAVWIAVAVVIVLAGLAMTVFPGPATVVVPLGLAMLAAVFGWARTLLLKTVERSAGAADRIRSAGTAVKVLTAAAVVCAVAGVAVWLLL